jgi:hypothetical protein
MITDGLLQLSSAQAVTASAVSTNTIDLGVARDIGAGQDLYVVVTVDESFATATSVAIQFISSAAANLGSATILAATDSLPIANLAAGRKPIILQVPRAQLNAQPVGQRYVGLNYAVTGSNATAGKFTANIVLDVQDIGKYYASGFTVV